MGNKYADRQKDDQFEGDLYCSSNNIGKLTVHNTKSSESKPWNLIKGAQPGRTLILNLIQSEPLDKRFQELFFKRSHGLGNSIPKHLVSLDEKYLRRCLELIHMNVSKGAPCALSLNLSSLVVEVMSDCAPVARRHLLDGTKYAIDYPMNAGRGDLVTSPVDEEIVGSIMGSNTMMNILSSPLFQRLGISDHDARLGRTSLFGNKRYITSDYLSSPGRLTSNPSQKPGKETLAFRNQHNVSDPVQRSPISESSGLTPLTDQSSASSFSLSDSQGMLRCTLEGGIPHFTFSLDDQKELYVANASKVEVTNDKAFDYVYSFHLEPSGQKMSDIYGKDSELIGTMKVSTSFSLCSNNTKIMETEYVLFGRNENHTKEVHALNKNSRRSRKLSRVMEVFKSANSLKQRTPSVFGGTSLILEEFSPDKALPLSSNLDQPCRPDLSEIDFVPNLEMAAIVVKDHIQDQHNQKEEVGGWGLNFLKKAAVKQNVTSVDGSASSESDLRSSGNCSTSMDIIVPAGPHGGPRTANGGPTSLIKRWKLGGQCDCGGWDIGCPLKILKVRPRREQSWPSSEASGNCKSFEIYREGSKQETPVLKMINIHDDLYFISFQSSSLSALHCFSIIVAIIHSRSPSLRPKHVQECSKKSSLISESI